MATLPLASRTIGFIFLPSGSASIAAAASCHASRRTKSMKPSTSAASPASSGGRSALRIFATSAEVAVPGAWFDRGMQLEGCREQPITPKSTARRTRLPGSRFQAPGFGQRRWRVLASPAPDLVSSCSPLMRRLPGARPKARSIGHGSSAFANPWFGERPKTSLGSQAPHDRCQAPLKSIDKSRVGRRVNRFGKLRQLAASLKDELLVAADEKRDGFARHLGRPLKEGTRRDRGEQLDGVRPIEVPALFVGGVVAQHFGASPIELVPVAVERCVHVALHPRKQLVGQNFDTPKVEKCDLALPEKPVVAGMRIGIEDAVPEHGAEHELPYRHTRLIPLLLRSGFAKFLVGHSSDELGRENPTGREGVVDPWDDNVRQVAIHPAK